jgi:energy-coupling factor transport system substrate-specific component
MEEQPGARGPVPTAMRSQTLTLVSVGIVLNMAIGTLVHVLKLPVYLDAVGTIIVTLLAGIPAGVITGVFSFLLGGLVTNPVLPWFSGTQAAIAIYCGLLAARGAFSSYTRTALTGVGLGVVAGVVSAPVIVYLFGGITGSGASLIVAFLLASGRSLLQSVLLSGVAAEPVDKLLQCLLATWLLHGVPKTILGQFREGYLIRNGFIRA